MRTWPFPLRTPPASPVPCGRTRPPGSCRCPTPNVAGVFSSGFANTPAPDAESLMRSRYTAFAAERADYLLATWHPSKRPASVDFEPGVKWLGLEVRSRSALDADHAEVEFVARLRGADGAATRLHERSRFVREDDGLLSRWYYVVRRPALSPSAAVGRQVSPRLTRVLSIREHGRRLCLSGRRVRFLLGYLSGVARAAHLPACCSHSLHPTHRAVDLLRGRARAGAVGRPRPRPPRALRPFSSARGAQAPRALALRHLAEQAAHPLRGGAAGR